MLPAINLHNPEFWLFIVWILFLVLAVRLCTGINDYYNFKRNEYDFEKMLLVPPIGRLILLIGIIVIIFIGLLIASAPIFHSNAYTKLIDIKLDGNFQDDVAVITFNQIPTLDKQSAQRLGDRKMGEFADLVSQFEVSDDYAQINFQNRPVRVTPLLYGGFFKWINNRAHGLPGYIMIDMVTQEGEVIRLDKGIKYSKSDKLGRNIDRHVRFHYPTLMFARDLFEIDDSGHPYWLYPVEERTIGWFGGKDITGLVVVDTITGDSMYYNVGDVPEWIDHVFPSELILEQYDWYGAYQNGWLNSIFGQRGVTMTTEGYNFLVIGDDLYVYTGITSVGRDESNIGFILTNQRTKETTYYAIPGSHEYSAMASAEGAVQHLRYTSTFPLLLNIAGEPTYFIELKDDGQLVKMYAMVNVRQYNIVATGTTVQECELHYRRMLSNDPSVGFGEIVSNVVSGSIDYIVVYVDGQPYKFVPEEAGV
jgi:hypothetical protein